MQTVLGLLWSTGMRPNEVASLKYKDFDIENNLLRFMIQNYIKIELSLFMKVCQLK